jgi:Na+:H+ antiporter, NhaC family
VANEPALDPALEGETPAGVRRPSLGESLLAIGVLVVLISTTVLIFGTDATGGPLQVALMTSAVLAGLLSLRLGNRVAHISDAVVGGISSAMSAIFILLAVGALIGTWNMAGTIPTVVYYGLGILNETWFYVSTVVICGLVGLVIGSSWTTAATLGVAFVALAPLLGANPVIAAGAVISGAYFGDKMTPLSETTVLVPSMVGGVTVNQHVSAMIWSSGPAILITLVLFAILGLSAAPVSTGFDPAQAQATLASEFNITPLNLLPLVVLVILSVRRVPPFLSIFGCALFAGILAWFTQPALVQAFVGGTAGVVVTDIKALYMALANGFVSNTGVEQIDQLFSRGGMSSMLTTIWLILGALSYASIVEHAGFLARIIEPVVNSAKTTGRLIASVVFTAIGLNILAGDQYVAIVMPSRVYRLEFARRGIAPRVLSRTVEDAGTVTSPLVPWNSCGAYMAGVLGVATISYLPYALFNLISPIIALIYGFTGFRIERLPQAGAGDGEATKTESKGAVPETAPAA